MKIKDIEKKAKHYSKLLIIGCASAAMLGTLSGCSSKVHKESFRDCLQSNAWFSPALNKTSREYFDDNFIHDANSRGPVNSLEVDLAFSHGKIGAKRDDGGSDAKYPSKYKYRKNIDSDDAYGPHSDEGDSKQDKETMHYKFTGKKSENLILYQTPRRRNAKSNNIEKIKYENETPQLSNHARIIILRPIYVMKYKNKHYVHVPVHMANHNKIILHQDFHLHVHLKHHKANESLNSLP